MFEQIIDCIKNFGTVEWSLVITCFIELVVILFFNKGILICKDKLMSYEDEIRGYRESLEHAQNQITILKGGDIDED